MTTTFVAAATTPITIALPMATSAAAWIIVALLAVIAWFVRRDIRNNDVAHTELRADVKKLLEGDVAWIRSLLERHPPVAEQASGGLADPCSVHNGAA